MTTRDKQQAVAFAAEALNRVRDHRAEFEFYHRNKCFRSNAGLAWIVRRMDDYKSWVAE